MRPGPTSATGPVGLATFEEGHDPFPGVLRGADDGLGGDGLGPAGGFGISGDRTQHVLWRFDHGELDIALLNSTSLALGVENAGLDDLRIFADEFRDEDALVALADCLTGSGPVA